MRDLLEHPLARAALLMLAALGMLIGLQRASRAGEDQSEPEGGEPAQTRALRVLFVGNSLSAPIPSLLAAMGSAARSPIRAAGHTPGGKTLEYHAAAPTTLQRIAAGTWDAVVLQDQGQRPSYTEEQRAREMYPAGTRLVQAVREAGAQAWLYGAYARPAGDPDNRPGDDYSAMQARVDDGYARLAALTSTRVVPVGRAFSQARSHRAQIGLWKSDGVHASAAGSYLAAATFFAALTKRDPRALAFDGELAPADARALREIAASTVERELGTVLSPLVEAR